MQAISLLFHDVVQRGRPDPSGFEGALAERYKLDWERFDDHVFALAYAARRAPTSVDSALRQPGYGPAPLLVTFDDGGRSAHRVGALLDRLGWVGHFFVATDYIGSRGFLSRDGIRELDAMGHVVGSHSRSHPQRFSHCRPDLLAREWGESVERLSEILERPVTVAAVPGGSYARRVAEAASAAGIRALFTSEPVVATRIVDRCTVFGRFCVTRHTSAREVAALVSGRRLPQLRRLAVWNAKKGAKVVARGAYPRVSRAILERLESR